MRRLGVFLLTVMNLAGCGPFVPVVKISDLPPEERKAVEDVRVYDATELGSLEYRAVQDVIVYSCKHLLWDPPASREDATLQLKKRALDVGANGITNIQCTSASGTSLATNCWETITCLCQAIQVTGKKP